MAKKEFPVEFRYLGIQAEKGEIAGICLCYGNAPDAYSFFNMIQMYVTASIPALKIPMKVKFTQTTDDAYDLQIKFGIEDAVRLIYIQDIDASYIERLKASLLIYQYYLVVAGYVDDDGNFQLLPVKDYHLFKSDVQIDGETLQGNDLFKFDWTKLLE